MGTEVRRRVFVGLLLVCSWLLAGCDPEALAAVLNGIDLDGDKPTGDIAPEDPGRLVQDCPKEYYAINAGNDMSNGVAINDYGVVTGANGMPGAVFIWSPINREADIDNIRTNAQLTTIDTINNNVSEGIEQHSGYRGQAINNRNEIALQGHARCIDHPFATCLASYFWSEDDGFIPILYGAPTSVMGLNEHGVAVGDTMAPYGPDGIERHGGFYWTKEDGLTMIPPMEGTPDDAGHNAWAINDLGVIVGNVQTSAESETQHAYKWSAADGYTILEDFGNLRLISSSARAVNNKGQAAGLAFTMLPQYGSNAGVMHPVLWEADGTMIDLGFLAGDPAVYRGESRGINNHGIVVGHDASSHRLHSWRYCGGVKTDLEKLLVDDDKEEWELLWPSDINDEGWIVGTGYHLGKLTTYVLVPVPDTGITK